ncbi:MAG: photosystem II biogenesis protein Psp29 [Cyanobacteria bacterium P01_H01_bin.58]
MSNVRTVSDTKRAFYTHFTRPITPVYRRVIEELMVEMHLLSVSSDFAYDSLYALGIVNTFDRFMDGYRPETDKADIFNALCQSVESSAEQYRNDAQQLLDSLEGMSLEDFKALTTSLEGAGDTGLPGVLHAAGQRDRFKYSRAFGLGLYTTLEKIDPEFVKNKEDLMAVFKTAAETLSISFDKLQKDIELYSSNLDKMAQAKIIMADMLAAERKKREERAQAKTEKDNATQTTDEASVSTSAGEAGEADQSKSAE